MSSNVTELHPPNVDPDTGELFDTAEYAIPFPKADDHEVTDLTIRFAGSLNLNRNDPRHAHYVEQLKLGDMTSITATATIDGKHQTYRTNQNGATVVTHVVTLRIDALDI